MRDFLALMVMNLKEMLPEDSLWYVPKDECVRRLKRLSGRDFGQDFAAWEAWVEQYRKDRSEADESSSIAERRELR